MSATDKPLIHRILSRVRDFFCGVPAAEVARVPACTEAAPVQASGIPVFDAQAEEPADISPALPAGDVLTVAQEVPEAQEVWIGPDDPIENLPATQEAQPADNPISEIPEFAAPAVDEAPEPVIEAGKSTTLHRVLNEMVVDKNHEISVYTIEKPVEPDLPEDIQVPVKTEVPAVQAAVEALEEAVSEDVVTDLPAAPPAKPRKPRAKKTAAAPAPAAKPARKSRAKKPVSAVPEKVEDPKPAVRKSRAKTATDPKPAASKPRAKTTAAPTAAKPKAPRKPRAKPAPAAGADS